MLSLVPGMGLTAKAAEATTLTAETTTWENGDYVVPANGVAIGHITVNGTVNLMLTEGTTLTANAGITLSDGATLNVSGEGAMTVNGTNNSTASTVAGNGTLVLTSGTLTAKGGNGQGIGDRQSDQTGANGGTAINGSVIMNGGTLTATGGNGGSVGAMNIDCKGGNGGAAISGTLTVNGGTMTATNGAAGSLGSRPVRSSAGAAGASIGGKLTLGKNVTLYDGLYNVLDDNNSSSREYNGDRTQIMHAVYEVTYAVTQITHTPAAAEGTVSMTYGDSSSTLLPGETSLDDVKGKTVTLNITPNSGYRVKSVTVEKPAEATITLDNTTTAWRDGTYAVPAGGLTYSDAITVSGDVTLVLTDGETLTLNKGIGIAEGATLTIQGEGTMNVNGTNSSTASTVAGCTGTLVLTSGTLTAKGGDGQGFSSFGDSRNGAAGGVAINGNVTVEGGTLTATGGNGGSIGSDAGPDNRGGNGGAAISLALTINGGTVTTTNGSNGTSSTQSWEHSSAGSGGKAVVGTVTDNTGTNTETGGAGNESNPEETAAIIEAEKQTDGSWQFTMPDYSVTLNIEYKHQHNFTYELSADTTTITATCSADNCPLTNKQATLTIAPSSSGGSTAEFTGDTDDFDLTDVEITYNKKDSTGWNPIDAAAVAAATSEDTGFYKASATIVEGKTISVTYGINAIHKGTATGGESCDFNIPRTANVGAEIKPTLTLATGYEVKKITVKDGNTDVSEAVRADKAGFIMPDYNVTVDVEFGKIPYKIEFNPMSYGTVTASKNGNPVSETNPANYGDTITLTVTPETGFNIKTVKYNDTTITANEGVYSFTMPAFNVTVSAEYEGEPFDVTTVSDPTIGGTVSVTGDGVTTNDGTKAKAGTEVTLTVTPATGFQVDTVKYNNTTITPSEGVYKFTMPASNVTVTATFTPIDYTVTIDSAITNGTVTASKGSAEAPAHYQDEITLTVTPNYGYGLKTLSVTGANNSPVPVTDNQFTMPASNVTVSAEFAALTPYTVFYKTDDGVESVKCKIDGVEYAMTRNASLGGVACWAARLSGADGKSSFSLSFSTDNGSTWSVAASMTPTTDIPNNLNNDGSVVIKGDANALILALSKGTENISENAEDNAKLDFYLVTGNTTSISVPNPARAGYTFKGWEYNKYASGSATTVTINAGTGSTAIPVSGQITGSTIISAVWEKITPTVTFTEVAGISPQALEYAHTATKPANPTKEGYVLVGWVLAEKSIQRVNDTDRLLGAGSLFDFENTKVISDVTLKPVWKHVHSYAYRQISDFSALSAYSAYNSYYHVRICTGGCGSIDLEPHNLNSLGRCACGYVSPDGKYFVTPYTEGTKSNSVYMVKPNSEFQLFAPLTKGNQQFSKWQYRLSESGQWNDLSAYNSTGIIVPADLNVNATYKSLTQPDLYLYSFLNDGHLYFQFDYTLPTGWTAQDAYILSGNNFMLRYMQWNEVGAMDVRFAYETKNAITEFGKDTIRNKMVNGKAVNISGGSDVRLTRVSNVGNSGTVQDGYHADDVARDNGEMFFYAVGVVRCKDNNGAQRFLLTAPIWATQKDQSDHYSNLES